MPDDPIRDAWARQIVLAHGGMAVVAVTMAVLARRVHCAAELTGWHRGLPLVAAVLIIAWAIAVTVIDQAVTASVNAYVNAVIAMAIVHLFPPATALIVLTLAWAGLAGVLRVRASGCARAGAGTAAGKSAGTVHARSGSFQGGQRHARACGRRSGTGGGGCAHVALDPANRPARWGGEEFVLLLPDTGCESAPLLAEKLRHAVGDAPMPGMGSSVTVSIGAVVARGDALPDWPVLPRMADEALYQAKREGRNRAFVRCLKSDRSSLAKNETR